MRNRPLITSLICGLTILVAGCELTSDGQLNPSAPSQVDITPVLLGTWTSISSVTTGSSTSPSAQSCTDLEFTFTEQNGNFYAGTFTATCADGIELIGTASGTYVDGVMTVTGTGTTAVSGVAQCPFTLSATAQVTNSQIDVDYSVNSCLGSLSGSEVLGKT